MKFAKELEQDLVPEWRVKYLHYKVGKQKVKAVARAVSRANATPRSTFRPSPARNYSMYGSISPFAPKIKTPSALGKFDWSNDEPVDPLRGSSSRYATDPIPESDSSEDQPPEGKETAPMPLTGQKKSSEADEAARMHDSLVATPPSNTRSFPFQLPAPALAPESPVNGSTARPNLTSSLGRPNLPQRSSSMSVPRSAYEVGQTTTPQRKAGLASLRNRIPPNQSIAPIMRRIFSVGTPLSQVDSHRLDMDMVAVDQVRIREKEFFAWMDSELEKVETFYKSKEEEARARLEVLREQLHEMRNRRNQEVAEALRAKATRKEEDRAIFDFNRKRSSVPSKNDRDESRPNSRDPLKGWMEPLGRIIGEAKAKAIGPHPGPNSKALQNMQKTPEWQSETQEGRNRLVNDGRDYVRRHQYDQGVPYRTAKRKLKLALQEFYRGMELLKSYSLLNRTAFRKINKKYDKVVDAHPPLRYMSDKVNKAWFVQSAELDGYMHVVEDLYARYFERGNHKIATGRLRSSSGRPTDLSASAFKNGLLVGTGAVFSIQGIIYGADLLHHPDPNIQTQTSYLLQIYAGYFLALYLFSWFCLDCSIWTRKKINYAFVFEFDPRHTLDWRQLAEFPSFLILVLGIFVWLNFSRYGSPEMFIYYPVILIFITAVIIFFPGPVLFHRSRSWFVYSHWRLLLAGLYPVEFRDFFLGDMYCSLTYFAANIELFFCLYGHHWNRPSQCNSSHSHLLGFFTTLPGIWRALQCIRRYYDTHNVFPHLVNCGKYSMTIIYYTALSLFRIHKTDHLLIIFTTFATINAIYCSIWDLLMDWSLLQHHAKARFLRDVRGYKSTWWYYAAMILDPILRFNWIFYAIYTRDLQHSTLVSFVVAFSEVTRRGIWTLFRVENEHCSNVLHFKASRDVPLPYDLDTCSQENDGEQNVSPEAETTQSSPQLSRHRSRTGATLEGQESAGSSMRRRPTVGRTISRIVADAHMQDFEKKRKPAKVDADNLDHGRSPLDHDHRVVSSDDDEDDEQDTQEILCAEELHRDASGHDRGDDT